MPRFFKKCDNLIELQIPIPAMWMKKTLDGLNISVRCRSLVAYTLLSAKVVLESYREMDVAIDCSLRGRGATGGSGGVGS